MGRNQDGGGEPTPTPSGQWTELGPAPIGDTDATGRVAAIAVSSTNQNLYYIGAADGGVWKTTNGGNSWTPLTDHLPTTAIGAVAVDPTNDQIVYAGSGEANFANHSRYGLGIYKTTDGGSNWDVLAADQFSGRCVSRILIDGENTDTLYASLTHAGGVPSFQFSTAGAHGHPGALLPLGIWKSEDGARNWTQLLNGIPGDLSVTSMVMDPTDPAILYAGVSHIFGDARNGVYKSMDNGNSWQKLGGGFPTADVGHIALAIPRSNRLRIYANVVRNADSTGGNGSTLGLYRSDDGGITWTLKTTQNFHRTYGWYLNTIIVHPTNPDTVFTGGVHLYRSTDGGDSWDDVLGAQHVDFHALCYDAAGRLVSGNDGGVYRSENNGNYWTALNSGLGIIQFYPGISVHPDNPATIYGGSQDNGTLKRTGTNKEDWIMVLGGDGGCTAIHPENTRIVYAEFQRSGNLYRSTSNGSDFTWFSGGIDANDPNSFICPFRFAPGTTDLYYATDRMYVSSNGDSNFTAISGSLAGTGGAAIRGFAIAPSNPRVFYAGTNDGRILVSTNGGGSWNLRRIDVPGWPRMMRQFAVHPEDHLTAYLAVGAFGTDQVLVTQDGGQNWTALDNNLVDIPVHTVCLDPSSPSQIIYLGTDKGVYRSTNGGDTWQVFGDGLPNCKINDMKVDAHNNQLLVATQGRGMWLIATQ